MQPFDISRIHTSQGILQLSGYFSAIHLSTTTLLMMGTDGWFELDLQQDNVKTLVETVQQEIISYLHS